MACLHGFPLAVIVLIHIGGLLVQCIPYLYKYIYMTVYVIYLYIGSSHQLYVLLYLQIVLIVLCYLNIVCIGWLCEVGSYTVMKETNSHHQWSQYTSHVIVM